MKLEVADSDSSGSSDSGPELHFKVNDVPKYNVILLYAFQQMMLCISGLLVMPFLVSEFVCASEDTAQLRVQLISATFVASGIATILQTTFGLRLCILHGPSFAFLPTLIVFKNSFKCDPNDPMDAIGWQHRFREIQGSLLAAVSIMLFFGSTGLIGIVSKSIGPITIVPLLILLTLGSVPELVSSLGLHWIGPVQYGVLLVLAIYLERVNVPIPYFSFAQKRFRITKQRIFGQFPYLIGIGFCWFLCFLITYTDIEPVGGQARIDKNETMSVLDNAPWIQFPVPFHLGGPSIDLALCLGFVASTLACMMESLGDYEMCAQVSQQASPPSASVNRAIICEGLGSSIAAVLGVGSGVTTYAENIALMHVTRVTSRITMQSAGCLLILFGIFPKAAALLASLPKALVAGILGMGMSMIMGVAFTNLQRVDIRLSRNLSVMGAAILIGMVVPTYVEQHPFNTGNLTVDNVLNMLLKIKMLVGGLAAFLLDNTVGGATKMQRGFPEKLDLVGKLERKDSEGYILPDFVTRLILRFPLLAKLPFLPRTSH